MPKVFLLTSREDRIKPGQAIFVLLLEGAREDLRHELSISDEWISFTDAGRKLISVFTCRVLEKWVDERADENIQQRDRILGLKTRGHLTDDELLKVFFFF